MKNTIGGKKGKMLSKKQHSTNHSSFPVSTQEPEIYVCVMKIFGGGVFEVIDKNKVKYKAYLRGKMKGSNKRHNLVSLYSILLVGLREYISDKASVDILFVYEPHHIQTLSLHSQFPVCLLSYAATSGTAIGSSSIPISEDALASESHIDSLFFSESADLQHSTHIIPISHTDHFHTLSSFDIDLI